MKFQDQIFSKFQDIFNGFTRLRCRKCTLFCAHKSVMQINTRNNELSRSNTVLALNDSNKHVVMICKKYGKLMQDSTRPYVRVQQGHSYQMTQISEQFLISEQFQDNFEISGISGISGQLGALWLLLLYNVIMKLTSNNTTHSVYGTIHKRVRVINQLKCGC